MNPPGTTNEGGGGYGLEMTGDEHQQQVRLLASISKGDIVEGAGAEECDSKGKGMESKQKAILNFCYQHVWESVAVGSMIVNIVAMAFEVSAVMIVAGIVASALAVVVVFFQCKLMDVGTLRRVQNMLRKQVNRLANENIKLAVSNNELEKQVTRYVKLFCSIAAS